jgi:hypothetical protein
MALNNGYKKDDILNMYNWLKYQQNNQGNNTKMYKNELHSPKWETTYVKLVGPRHSSGG